MLPLLSLDEIRNRLADRRLHVVAKATGLSYPVILNIRNGAESGLNPTLRTMQLLSDYLTKDA